MPQSLPTPENKRHYAGLDGLRAIAVLMVFAQHYLIYPESYGWGWVGVHIFFVLSGFLITGILYDTRDAPNRYRAFYARRALRIFPLYFAVLAAGWALWPIFRWELHPAWWLAPLYLTNYSRYLWLQDFLHGNGVEHLRALPQPPHWFRLLYGHFWSLSVEEQFYLVWPFVVFTVRERKRLLQICVAAVCITPLMRLLCTLTLPSALLQAGFVDRITPLQLDSLLLGAVLALWIRGDPKQLTRLAYRVVGLAAMIFPLFEFIYFESHHRPYIVDWGEPVFASFGLSAVNLVAAALILLAINAATSWSRFLSMSWLQSLGKISYGFYVFHDVPHVVYLAMALFVVNAFPTWHLNAYGLLTAAFALGGTLLLSALSFRYLETPFLRLKARFIPEPADGG